MRAALVLGSGKNTFRIRVFRDGVQVTFHVTVTANAFFSWIRDRRDALVPGSPSNRA